MISLVSLADLSRSDVLDLFHEADQISAGNVPEAPRGRLVVPLFFRGAGEADLLLRVGAATLGAPLIDAERFQPGFPRGADLHEVVQRAVRHDALVVLGHDVEGIPGRLAETGARVLAAGDGTRGDALAGLVALDLLREALGTLDDRTIALCGDLRRNPVAHSVLRGLAVLGTRILLVPSEDGALPEGLMAEVAFLLGGSPVRFPAHTLRTLLDMVDTVFLSPGGGSQMGLFDALPPSSDEERRRTRREARSVDAMILAAPCDGDGRCASGRPAAMIYREPFREGANPGETLPWCAGPGRERALTAALLDRVLGDGFRGARRTRRDVYRSREGLHCDRLHCVTSRWPDRYEPRFTIIREDPVLLACRDCGAPARARFVGSRHKRRYHPLTSRQVTKIKRENVVFFRDERQAEEAGYVPSRI